MIAEDWRRIGTGPLYRRLASAIESAIRSGRLPTGARLPTERQLARDLALSRRTVLAAYDELEERGLLVARQGSGTYVGTVPRDAWAAPDGPVLRRVRPDRPGVVDLSLAAPAALPMVAGALAAAAGSPEMAAVLGHAGYEAAGLPVLRRAIADRLAALGVPTEPAQVLVTTGAQQAISLLAALLVRPGQPAVVETPTYPGALDVLRAAGARLLPVPSGMQGAGPEAVRQAARQGGAQLVHLTPSFHNPTGALMPLEARRRLALVADELQVPLVEDGTLADLELETPPPPPIAAFGQGGPIFTVGSMSKLFWGGLRVGWVRGPAPAVERLARLKAVADLGSSTVSQLAAAALLPRATEAVEARRRELLPRRDRLVALLRERLPGWTWLVPEGGLSLWARMPAGSAAELAEVALPYGVGIVPGGPFTADETGRDRIRLTFAAPVETLELGVDRLAAAWEAYSAGARPAARPPVALV